MKDFLSFSVIFASLFWFAWRAEVIARLAQSMSGATEYADLRARLVAAYMKVMFLSIAWLLPATVLGCHGEFEDCVVVQVSWNLCLFVLYFRADRNVQKLAAAPVEKFKGAARMWAVFAGFFLLSTQISRFFDQTVLDAACAWFGPAYHAWGGHMILSALLFSLQMFAFVELSPWLFRAAFRSRRESDPAVLMLVAEVFSRANRAPPKIVRLDTGRGQFAAVTGLRPTLLLSDSLVASLSEKELEAVVAHELVHVARGHLVKRVAWFLALFALHIAFCDAVAWDLVWRGQKLGLYPAPAAVVLMFSLALAGFVGLLWALRKVVRFQEMEADAFAVASYGADPRALVGALDRILLAAKRPRDKQSFLSWLIPAAAHPTVAEREGILLRAERRARRGRAPLRAWERAFAPVGFLQRAARIGFTAALFWMLPAGIMVAQQREATEGLVEKAEAGDIRAMRFLISHGADPRHPKALAAAAKTGRAEAARLLLSLGSDPHMEDSDGNDAFAIAWRSGHRELAAYFDAVSGTQKPETRTFLRSAERSLASKPAK